METAQELSQSQRRSTALPQTWSPQPQELPVSTHRSTASTSKQNLFSMESVFRRVQDFRVTASSSP